MGTKYKVGDKVKVKSLEWYESNKDKAGDIYDDCYFTAGMSEYCGKDFEIESIRPSGGIILKGIYCDWRDWMFEDKPDIITNKQQILEQLEHIQQELDKLRVLCNN